MNTKRGAAQNKPAQHDHRQRNYHQPRDRPEIVIAYPLEINVGVDNRGAIRQQIRRPAQRRIGAKRDDKRRQSGKGHQRAVEQPQQQAEHQRCRDRQHGELRAKGDDHRRHRCGAEDRTHGKIDPAGQNDEGHPRRQNNVDRCLAGNIQQVAFGKKVWRDKAKYRHDQNQNGQDADRLHQIAHQHFFGRGFCRGRHEVTAWEWASLTPVAKVIMFSWVMFLPFNSPAMLPSRIT